MAGAVGLSVLYESVATSPITVEQLHLLVKHPFHLSDAFAFLEIDVAYLLLELPLPIGSDVDLDFHSGAVFRQTEDGHDLGVCIELDSNDLDSLVWQSELTVPEAVLFPKCDFL